MVQEPAWPAGVDHEPGAARRRRVRAARLRARRRPRRSALRQRQLVEVVGAFGAPPPAPARDRSRADTSACPRSRRSDSPRPAAGARAPASSANGDPRSWKKNVKPRFSPQATSGRAALPRAPLRERPQRAAGRSGRRAPRAADWRAASSTRRWRSADAARARSARRRGPAGAGISAVERAGEAGADDGDVGVDACAAGSAGMQRSGAARGAGDAARDPLLEIHRRSSGRAARSRQAAQSAKRGEIPEIDEDDRAAPPRRGSCKRQREAALDVQSANGGATNAPCAASAASRRCRRGSGRARRPTRRRRTRRRSSAAATRPVRPRHERRENEQEHTQGDAVRGEGAAAAAKSSSVNRLFRRSSASGMRRLQSHRDFERRRPRPSSRAAASRSRKRRAIADQRADATPRSPATRRRRVARSPDVGRRHRPGIEEAAGVVQLEAGHTDRRSAGPASGAPARDLRRDRAGRRVGDGGVSPQIAHHAAPRALAAGEEHRRHARRRRRRRARPRR